ncbi:MAG: hypothetical protein ABSE73_25115 [Planctomycetota bacterium]
MKTKVLETTGGQGLGKMVRRRRLGRKRRSGSGLASPSATKHLSFKPIEQLAAEQGVKPAKWEEIVGLGADLWKSDKEFEEFVAGIYARRHADREGEKKP